MKLVALLILLVGLPILWAYISSKISVIFKSEEKSNVKKNRLKEISSVPFSLIWESIEEIKRNEKRMDGLRRIAEIENELGNNEALENAEYLEIQDMLNVETHKYKQSIGSETSMILGSFTGGQFIYCFFKGKVESLDYQSARNYYTNRKYIDLEK